MLIRNIEQRTTRQKDHIDYSKVLGFTYFVFNIEPNNVQEALQEDYWVNAMMDELNLFERNEVSTFVEIPKEVNIIGTKWILVNKIQENNSIIRINFSSHGQIRVNKSTHCSGK